MITSAASGPKNKTRSKAAPALNSRLTRYLSISVGACAVGSQESFADIVNINVGASGFNIDGVNGGASAGTQRNVYNFPITGTNRTLRIYNNSAGLTGLGGTGLNLQFAVNSLGNAQIKKFYSTNSIDNTSTFTSNGNATGFKYFGNTAADFSTTDYVGFRFGNGINYNYGWLQTTWNSSTNTFQINSGAYESTVNTAILAGAAAPVPEPGTLALGSLALLTGGGAAVRRYRKQRQQQAITPVAEPAPEGAESASVS
jgi:hypothetical protein